MKFSFLNFVRPRGQDAASKSAAVINSNVSGKCSGQSSDDNLNMKVIKYIIIGLAVATFVYLIYFATQMSAVYDPVKIYQIGLTENEVYTQLTKISELKPNLKIVFSDSIGSEKEGRDYHCDMTFKDTTNEYAFHFIYKRNNHDDENIKSEIELINAIDYGLKIDVHDIDHKEASRLVSIFEREITNKLGGTNTSR